MGSTFGDLDQYLDPGLTLTIRGERYTIPLAPANLGLWCRRVAEAAARVHSASTEAAAQAAMATVDGLPEIPGGGILHERLLGDALRQMIANDLPDEYVKFAAETTFVWIVGGEDAARRHWESGGRPPAPGPLNRAQRRTTRTGGAPGTPPPASTSGTSTRRRSHGRGGGHPSRGGTS